MVRTRPSYQEIKVGANLYINLDTDAVPPASFQWYKNGYILTDQKQQALIITNASLNHSGTYSCEVQNVAGSLLWLEATVLVVQ